ncbi:prosalusin isoform X1 [Hippocampus comes]|uniref:prosalusin isoform X1 n=1 Tax=Hippocampus comes TaxID=109280 RepID=UPI00094EC46D|nr:PREDICTED: prosalusin isoform X1 [Hippocampus comes]
MITILPLLLLCVCAPARCVFQKLYCTIADSCDCDFRPNVRELEWDLYKNVFGQHLAQEVLSEEVARFLAQEAPEKPLVLSLHGSSGTGKTMAGDMLARHLYASATGSPFVHQFIPTLHFPAGGHVQAQREQLKSWVQGNVTECARSVFIFDEMDKMAPGLLDVLEPFLGPSHVVFRTNYRKAIYIFISTAGEEVINKAALEQREAGRDREEMTAAELQDAIARAVYDNPTTDVLSRPRWPLQLAHHPSEACDRLCALLAAVPPPRGAMRAGAAVPARRLWAPRRSTRGGGRHDLPAVAGTLLFHQRLQKRARQDQPAVVTAERVRQRFGAPRSSW